MTYVVWLNNNADSQDDEWVKVTASNKNDAKKRALHSPSMNENRFSIGEVYTIKEFEKIHGKGLLE